MSPSFSEGFDAQNFQELMGKENFVGWIPTGSTRATVGGRRFSDVTNSGLSFYSSHIKNLDNIHREDFDKTHLQQEIARLKKQLTEKEAILQYTRHEMHKVLQYKMKASQQNLQLAQTNGQMFAELCMIRGKLKLLQHDYNQMSAMYKVKTTELEQKVSDLSKQLQDKHQIGTKEPDKSEDTLQVPPKCLLPAENQNCATQRLGWDLKGGENSSRIKLSADEDIIGKRSLASSRESKLTTKCRQEGKEVFNRTLNEIDQSNASVGAGVLSNEVNSSSRENESKNEEASNVNRVSTGRRLASNRDSKLATKRRQERKTAFAPMLNQIDQRDLPNEVNSSSRSNGSRNEETSNVNRRLATSKESKLATKRRQEGKTIFTPTLNQIGQSEASSSAPEILEEVCTGDLPSEVNSSSKSNVSTNGKASNVNRESLRRSCTEIQDKEPPLHDQQEENAVFASTLKKSEQSGDSISRLETTLQEVCADNICTEAYSLSTENRSANEEASNDRRTILRRRSANVCYKEPPLNKKLRQQGLAVSTQNLFRNDQHSVSSSNLEIPEVYKGDISNEADSSSKINLTSNGENKKVKRVCLRRHSTSVTYRDSDMNGNYKQEKQTVLTPRFCESDQCSASFSGLETLEKVSEDEELQVQDKEVLNGDLNETSEGRQSCVFPTTGGNSCKAGSVKCQSQVQGIAPCQGLSVNATLEPTEMSRRSLAGRPVRKAVEGIASYKEVPRNIKMRRSE